jgi:3D (Asp-Asp-Asp) domain-containing protein
MVTGLGFRIVARRIAALAMLLGPVSVGAGVANGTGAVEHHATDTDGGLIAKRLYVLVTAYCLRGRTATGSYVRPGTVAVDPHLVELGSRLFIPHYGYGKAEDTGPAIRGFHVDEWRPRCDVAWRSTRHEVITVWPR